MVAFNVVREKLFDSNRIGAEVFKLRRCLKCTYTDTKNEVLCIKHNSRKKCIGNKAARFVNGGNIFDKLRHKLRSRGSARVVEENNRIVDIINRFSVVVDNDSHF